MTGFEALRRACLEANLQLPALNLVIHTFGNVSVADRERGLFAIKPSGVEYDALTPGDMVIVDFAGRVVEGRLAPSSDTPTHACLYREFPVAGGIVHTHSTYATAWAQAARAVPVYGTTHADFMPGDVPCTPAMPDEWIAGDYEANTGRAIVEHYRRHQLDPAHFPMALAASHGPFAWGADGMDAVYHAHVLEELCRMATLTESINPAAARLNPALLRRHFERKHGPAAYYGQKS